MNILTGLKRTLFGHKLRGVFIEMTNLKLHIKAALAYFVLAAVLGVVLRSFHVVDISANYKFIVHTHSHIALLGWVYLALTTIWYKLYLSKLDLDRRYRRIFWFTQLTLLGMLLTFPFLGYAILSIIFSTLFLFASYWFIWFFLKSTPVALKKNNSFKCINAALWYLAISSLGPWTLGAIMNTLGAESIWYRLAIYYYLHFLYNGWMILALIGLLFYALEKHQIKLSHRTMHVFLWSINLGIVLSFFLSSLFANPPAVFYVLGGVGAISQLVAIGVLVAALFQLRGKVVMIFSSFQIGLLRTVTVLLAIKMILQLLTALPYFASLAATILDFTIGYLHWTFLGVITIGLFLFLEYFKLILIPRKIYFLYLTGFFLTEALIFYRAVAAWCNWDMLEGYPEVLAAASLLIALSLVLLLWINSHRRSTA